MQSESEIHLVTRRTVLKSANPETIRPIDVTDIVRETLKIVQECQRALPGIDQLLVELVTSLVVVRLRKGGSQ